MCIRDRWLEGINSSWQLPQQTSYKAVGAPCRTTILEGIRLVISYTLQREVQYSSRKIIVKHLFLTSAYLSSLSFTYSSISWQAQTSELPKLWKQKQQLQLLLLPFLKAQETHKWLTDSGATAVRQAAWPRQSLGSTTQPAETQEKDLRRNCTHVTQREDLREEQKD